MKFINMGLEADPKRHWSERGRPVSEEPGRAGEKKSRPRHEVYQHGT
jgi:hypothetical protein